MTKLQKIKIAAFLSLSICMVIVICVRSLGVRQGSSAIDIWQVYWLEVEKCAAVCMVSLTAFQPVLALEAPILKVPTSDRGTLPPLQESRGASNSIGT